MPAVQALHMLREGVGDYFKKKITPSPVSVACTGSRAEIRNKNNLHFFYFVNVIICIDDEGANIVEMFLYTY